MKWIKRLVFLSFFYAVLIAGGILTYQGYKGYREALAEKSVEEMTAEIESIDNYTTLDQLPRTLYRCGSCRGKTNGSIGIPASILLP